MSLNEALIKALEENNPFVSSSVADPLRVRFPDVLGLNYNVLRRIKGLINQKAKAMFECSPELPLAVTVLGEAGSGKTHLIGRLVKESANADQPYSFAYIRPNLDPDQGFRYLLQEIIVNLTYTKEGRQQISQLDIILAKIFSKVLYETAKEQGDNDFKKIAEKCQRNPRAALDLEISAETEVWLNKMKSMLNMRFHTPNNDFVNVMLQYFFYKEKRDASMEWLKGKIIDEAEAKLLRLSFDRSEQLYSALEDEAMTIIESLDLFIKEFGDRPLVIFFDQLENLDNQELINKFNKVAWVLSKMKSMFPVVFFKGTDWENRLKNKLDTSVLGRFETNLLELRGCSQEQAYDLIRTRLDFALRGMERPDELYPFHPNYKEELSNLLDTAEISPRLVITRANRLLNKLLNLPVIKKTKDQVLIEAFKTRQNEIKQNIAKFQPDKSRLTLAAFLYLNNRPQSSDYKILNLTMTKENVKYIDLEGRCLYLDQSQVPTAILIDVTLHHRAVWASLKNGVDQLQKCTRSKVVFIRDMRCPLPLDRWKKTRDAYDLFESQGGVPIKLMEEEAAWWYALAILKMDIEASDISNEEGLPLEMKDLKSFISSQVSGATYPAFKGLDDYFMATGRAGSIEQPVKPKPLPVNGPTPGWIEAAIFALKASPTKMMQAKLLAEKVSAKINAQVSVDILVQVLGEKDKYFNIFRAADGVIVTLKIG